MKRLALNPDQIQFNTIGYAQSLHTSLDNQLQEKVISAYYFVSQFPDLSPDKCLELAIKLVEVESIGDIKQAIADAFGDENWTDALTTNLYSGLKEIALALEKRKQINRS